MSDIKKHKSSLIGKVVDNCQRQDGTIKIKVTHDYKHKKYNGKIQITKYYFIHLDISKFDDASLNDSEFLKGKTIIAFPCAPKSKKKHFEFGSVI